MSFTRVIVTQWQFGTVKNQMKEETWLERIRQAHQMAINAREYGHVVVATTDEISRPHFEDTGAILLTTDLSGVGPPRRLGFQYAVELIGKNHGAIGWTEPENATLPLNVEAICRPIEEESVDLVIPYRTDEGIRSYPTPQIPWEHLGNYWCSIIFGRKLPIFRRDFFFAPVFFSPRAARFFTEYPGESKMPDLWDSIFCPRMDAFCSGARIAEVETRFFYPREQAEAESRDYTMLARRAAALNNIIGSLVTRRKYWEARGFNFGPPDLKTLQMHSAMDYPTAPVGYK